MDLTAHWVGIFSLVCFAISYFFVVGEEFTHMRKSKAVIFAAGVIWAVIAWKFASMGHVTEAEEAVKHFLVEFSELSLFLLAAMTFVNTMIERRVFDKLRSFLINLGLGYRSLFWITGGLAFCLSPIIDNLTAALVMCAVVMAVGKGDARFIGISCVNIVVAANAGGAFSPFGDITTLMLWQSGVVDFNSFFHLFVPSLVNFLIPAAVMSLTIENKSPQAESEEVVMKRGAWGVIGLFVATVATAVSFHNFLHLPPFLGMMTGMSALAIFGYCLRITHPSDDTDLVFDVFNEVARAEWDTLLFFFGVIMCVGGLGFVGYLDLLSGAMYTELGPTWANIMVGIMSALIDNIPVMVAVLQMMPEMDLTQWLLVALTAGVGGSMLSVGSAAGVALMGQARGYYTFFSHLKWTPVIAVGYGASIWVHLAMNSGM
ncbi:MAG: sodium:proton antiporter [Cellvibrionaceae bacterium]|nr:sodium:proton antiporter [Cellvibrionaceae bacterium]|tara:strand:- start:230 stop:1519 length:1290 start_codon:yes stop_codon:yes gene_type:complete